MSEVKWEKGTWPLEKMKLWEDNPRTISKSEFDKLKASIERKPYYMEARPIVLSDRTGTPTIIAGNQRYKAIKALGWKEAPYILFHCQTEEQEADIALTDNHNNGEWDTEVLANKFSDYPLEEWLGSDWEAIAEDFEGPDPDDLDEVEPEEIPEEPKSKSGELYALGQHRLLVGDSTSPATIAKLMGGGMADLIVTDPPYNVAVENSQGMTIENDNMASSEFAIFIDQAMKAMSESLKPGGSFYVWYGDVEDISFRRACLENGLLIKQCLIWAKNSFNLGRQDYQWQHEPCLYGWKEGAAHYFTAKRTLATIMEETTTPIDKMTKNELVELAQKTLEVPGTIIREDKPKKNSDHPTMKPVKLFARLILNSSKPGDKVLDPFGGSGTTIIACEQLGRKAYTVEYDPRYADVIIERWERLTGRKAELIK